jgi:hypothetical protein
MSRDRRHRVVRACRQARNCRRMSRKESRNNATRWNSICGSPTHFEGSFPDTEPGGGTSWKFVCSSSVLQTSSSWLDIQMRCICGSKEPNVASGKGRGIAMEPRDGAPGSSLVVANDQCTMGGSCDGSIGEPPRRGKLPGRTETGGPSSWRTLHIVTCIRGNVTNNCEF